MCGFGAYVDGSVESVNVVGLSEQPETTTSMDCTQSETLNDFIEIISNEYAGGQVCCLLSRLLLKKFDTWSWTDGYEFVHHMRKMSPYHTCLMWNAELFCQVEVILDGFETS